MFTDEELAKALFKPNEAEVIQSDLGIDNHFVAEELAELVRTGKYTTPSDEQLEEWNRESLNEARQLYGHETDDLLQRAQTLVRQNPALAKVLRESGQGSNPRFVRTILAAAKRKETK